MKRGGISDQFEQRYDSFVGDMAENTVSALLGQFAEEIWEGLKDKGILMSIEIVVPTLLICSSLDVIS